MFRLGRRDTGEVLGHVVAHAAAERVVIFTSRVLQVVVPLVVEHLVGSQVHCGVQQLKRNQSPDLLKINIGEICLSQLTVNPERSHPRPQKMSASTRPMM